MATGKLVNLEKTAEICSVIDEFVASYSKQNFDNFGKKVKKFIN